MAIGNAAPRSGNITHGRRHDARLLFGSLLLGVFLLPPLEAQAQGDSFPNLIFEPVALDIVAPESPEAESPEAESPETKSTGTENPESETLNTVRELTPLPQGATIDLQDLLEQRRAASAASADTIARDIAAYEQAILELEAAGGAFDSRLDQELLALGTLMQQAGDYSRAQELLDRALHINRVNYGLFSMNQVPIIERTIANHLARGDLVAADEQQEYLLYVQRKNFGDKSVDLLPALTRYAEWNLFAFRARLVPVVPPSAEADGIVAESLPNENSDIMLDFRTSRLINAHNVYQSIIHILTSNFGDTDARLLNLERQLALTNYLFITTFGLDNELGASVMPFSGTFVPYDSTEIGRPPLGFRQGRDALERRVNFLANETGTTPIEKAQAKLDLADWLLMFSKRMGALDVYMEAYQEMAAAGAAPEELAAIFNPAFPQEIPSFLEQPYTRRSLDIPADLPLEYKGYIDIEFELSRFGVPSSLSVLGKSPTASPLLEERLLRNLRRTQFRPRIADGAARGSETIQARFYFTY